MTKHTDLSKQLETLFSDVVVPEPEIRVQTIAPSAAEATLASPTLARMPATVVTQRPLRQERKPGSQWMMASLTVLALAVALGLLLFGPAGLEQRNQMIGPDRAAQAANAQYALTVTEVSVADEGTMGDSRPVVTDLAPSAAIAYVAATTPSVVSAQVIAAPLTRPATLTISAAGLPPTSEPTPVLEVSPGRTDVPTVPASPTHTQPPPTVAEIATATTVIAVSPTATEDQATRGPEATPTEAVEFEPTATWVQIAAPTATLLPSPAPTVVEPLPPTPTWTPAAIASPVQPAPAAPNRLVIPAINLEAPVITVGYVNYTINGQAATTFAVPDRFAVGWHHTSALPGLPGNTVLNGHQMINGGVFRDLESLGQNDEIVVYSGDDAHHYRVAEQYLLAEEGQPLSVRVENARWIMPTGDERLTLVTCAPYGKSSHRLVVVARPSLPSP